MFDLAIPQGRRLKATPGDYLHSLPKPAQIEEVTRFPAWIESPLLAPASAETFLRGLADRC